MVMRSIIAPTETSRQKLAAALIGWEVGALNRDDAQRGLRGYLERRQPSVGRSVEKDPNVIGKQS